MIDKKLFFYWAEQPLSWPRFISIASAKLLNKDWEITVYIPNYDNYINTIDEKTKERFGILQKIGIILEDTNMYDNKYSTQNNSDVFRWWKLSNESTLYADTDVIFVRPFSVVPEILTYQTIIGSGSYGFHIGFLGSEAKNRFFEDLYTLAMISRSYPDYQSAGVISIYVLLMSWHDGVKSCNLEKFTSLANRYMTGGGLRRSSVALLRDMYKDNNILFHPLDMIYYFDANDSRLYKSKLTEESLPNKLVGIHWWGNGPFYSEYVQHLDENNYKNQAANTFNYFANKIQEQVDNYHE